MLIIGHRGYSARFPENTILSFAQALAVGADGIELDVYEHNGEFVVFHDLSLQRMTDINSTLLETPLDEIKVLSLAQGQHIPMLREVIESTVTPVTKHKKIILNIEIKHLCEPKRLIDYLLPYLQNPNLTVVLSSFNHCWVYYLKQAIDRLSINFQSKIEFAALNASLPITLAQYAADINADTAAINKEMVTYDFVNDAHKRGLTVWVYTINTVADLKALVDMGVDAIFTDDPQWAINYFS